MFKIIYSNEKPHLDRGWWVILEYQKTPIVYGPYESRRIAFSAMEDSEFIDWQCCDTKHPDILDDVRVPIAASKVETMIDIYGVDNVIFVNPDESVFYGDIRPTQTS